jgi:tetratricopeptide (TPR) repeat protein
MITTRHMYLEVELVRWLILALAALALVLAAATLAAADPAMPPRPLPPEMAKIARPIAPMDLAPPFFPEAPPAREFPPAEAAARLWRILELQRTGRAAEALAGWEQLRLPNDTAHWRELARGAAYLTVGDLKLAQQHLQAAQQLAPGNAVVAYEMGILRLEQRAAAGRVPDDLNGRNFRLVAFTPLEDRAVFEMLAIRELNDAILRAPAVRRDERLLATDMNMEEAFIVPCVGDLLRALGADNFAGKAHHLLYGLHLDRGELLAAELDLDAAVATGLAPLYGYQDLAEAYVDGGQPQVLVRLLRKDMDAAEPWLRPACQRLLQWTREAVTPGPWFW